jgi:anti-sigma factor RsiW
VGRPTDVLTCYRARRRLGAYLDGALPAGDARWTEQHLTTCTSCQHEAGQIRRVKTLIAQASTIPEPDWTGFWPRIVRGIDEERRRALSAPPQRAWRLWPQWVGGAAVAALAASVVLWQGAQGPIPAEAGVLVNAATTENPGATVMVYTPPDRNMAVVWVFDPDP